MTTVVCSAPRVEHLAEAIGIGVSAPRLSWINHSDVSGWAQHAYELALTSNGSTVTELVMGDDQVLVSWPFPPLASRQSGELRVRVSDQVGSWSSWSEPTYVEAGLLDPADFTAKLISPSTIAKLDDPAPIISTTFRVKAGASRARLYVTAHGVYVGRINGGRVGDHVLAPGWTAYDYRLVYQTFDVADMLREGENTIEFTLGNGWYRGNLGRPPIRDLYGDRLGVLAQLEVIYEDGTIDTIVSNDRWTARDSNVLSDDLYNGQLTDVTGTAVPRDDSVDSLDFDCALLVAPQGPPVRVVDEIPAVRVFVSPSGRQLVDFGQNLVGWVRLTIRDAGPGSTVTVRHAEVLERGELGTRPLRTAKATDQYIVSGAQEEVLEPEFTFHGFRYVEVEGVEGMQLADLTAVVISSDLERTGWFECSDAELNRLHENVIWGMRGNFVSVPTDCPQRDERLGWTGDIQVFAPTASFLFDTAGFLSSWLADLSAEQADDGSVPYVIPDLFRRPAPAAAAWGDAATVVPWVLFQRFGDVGILERQFASMRGWVDKMDELAGEDHLWTGGFQYGDWLDPSAPPHDPAAVMTNHDLVATAHLARSAEIVAQAAQVLGKTAEYERYRELATATRSAFAAEYTTASGRLTSDSQTSYSLALEWALLPGDVARANAGRRLADLVGGSGFTIGTGFVGTPLILDALSNAGEIDAAYRLLLQRECPSWLYPITMGATTIWERWDSMLPDGTINPGQMTSFNHYAFGAVADWMHRSIAGLAPADPAYRTIVVQPILGGGLDFASARHLTPYGEVSVSWTLEGERFDLAVRIPTGTTAQVYLPGAEEPVSVESGTHSWVTEVGSAAARRPRPVSLTTRAAINDPELWAAITAVAKVYRPEWTDRDVSVAARQYLDRDVREVARIVGRSSILSDETSFAGQIDELVTAGRS